MVSPAGHIFHGELALDQMLTMRPLLGWGQYRTPIRDLYLVQFGDAPGNRFDRWFGRQRGARGPSKAAIKAPGSSPLQNLEGWPETRARAAGLASTGR